MDQDSPPIAPHAIRVLITGFGPFRNFNENPSWLAVRPFHNAILYTEAQPVIHDDDDEFAIITDEMQDVEMTPQPIHITCAQIPMNFQGVLATVPGLHARPPILPPIVDPTMVMPPPPENGYDFMLHVALAGRGPLRFEKLAHKHGYAMRDCEGQYAPAVPKEGPTVTPEASEIERMELHLQGVMSSAAPVEGHGDGPEIPPNRGFSKGYENFPEEIHTEIDVARLVLYMKELELENDPEDAMKRVYTSMDAGHYLCDYAFYCSLAEAKRSSSKQEKSKDRDSPARSTPVLAMHCPPVGQPLSTEQVTDAIKTVVVRLCSQLNQ
ncbi:peptidase C15 pyroglutamyl peptidase I-like protein [Rhodofomes roseus]|uniref:Peptidase C15 pyroglutamyl peptidase I-like protein n=1 Tax=Rhodofomes roseus TaxID=34475 RepID=A0A4Y9XRZ5_9APHY|nr:peptidase C15 pyroglutamyl peptidase I-like protein [Rhodofomes roseus]KAH9839559.1 peptidase C15 pyroglutamyl peptidase I-like protein [Rhodofomes roseus]TFY52866.1 hypothetical protein EVJ58_g9772 [Rhodofomes roseus]